MSNAEKAPYTSLLADKEKTDLGALDLFDRVINLKLTVAEKDKSGKLLQLGEYVIRSDYETYFPELMRSVASSDLKGFLGMKKCFIRKCQYKPSIKVQYKRVSMDVPVEVDIFVNNFFMLDKSGKMLKTFNNETNPLVKVELAMGYFGQFKDMLKPKAGGTLSVSDLFDFDVDKHSGHGITLITICDVAYVQTDKLPPDMTVHIHGFVGNLYGGRLEDIEEINKSEDVGAEPEPAKIAESYSDLVKSNKAIKLTDPLKRKTTIEQIFYEEVTRYYIRENFISRHVPLKFEKWGLIHGDSNVLDGKLTEAGAELYGIRVYLSPEAQKYAKKWDKDHVQKDSEGNDVFPDVIVPRSCATAIEQVNDIMKNYMPEGFSAQYAPEYGCIFVYKGTELLDPKAMTKGTELEKAYKKSAVALYWKDKLPAVYNITTDALCTITCPFFFFLSPFQKFYFKTRYALGGLVSYYANFNATEDEFYALWQNVSFATEENVNECTIVCTGQKKEGK